MLENALHQHGQVNLDAGVQGAIQSIQSCVVFCVPHFRLLPMFCWRLSLYTGQLKVAYSGLNDGR